MRTLVDTGIALASELSLDALLQRTVEAAAELTGARYAALGVLDPSGSVLERFVTTGIDEATRARIGDLPRGRGILGVLIADATPLRLRDLRDDPRSVGFPPGHPQMHSFLGVPVSLRGTAYGNLYLTEKEGGAEFTAGDLEVVTLLAAQVAVAVENARLYSAATRWSRQLELLNDVGVELVTEFDLARLLQLIAESVRQLIHARVVTIARPHGGSARIEAVAGAAADAIVGLEVGEWSKTIRVLERRRSERVDSTLDDPEINQDVARRLDMHSALYVPLLLRGEPIGVIAARDKEGPDTRFTDDDLRITEVFAQRAAVAVDLSRRVASDALQRVVTAQENERRRLARELHDETGQALTSILLGLSAVESADTVDGVRAALGEVRELVRSTLQDVRQLAVDLRPSALDDFGLVPALERLVESFGERTGIAVTFEETLPGRVPPEIETALYRIVQEALTNVVKHARARRVGIVLTQHDNTVAVTIDDDGVGFELGDAREGGLGLVGMRERIALLRGRFDLSSRPGSGTTFTAEVPLP